MKEAQRIVYDFLERRPIMREHDTLETIAEKMKGEIDELLAEITWGEREPTPEEIKKVSSELADVVIYALSMGSLIGVDVEQSVIDKIKINEERFPDHLFQEGDFLKTYLSRKRELREL